jgi:hypothetical protein
MNGPDAIPFACIKTWLFFPSQAVLRLLHFNSGFGVDGAIFVVHASFPLFYSSSIFAAEKGRISGLLYVYLKYSNSLSSSISKRRCIFSLRAYILPRSMY